MGKSQPAPPPAPDYTGAAVAQGKANLTASQQGAVLSNPNIYGPLGSQTVNYSNFTDPDGNQLIQPTITQSLNPDAQATLDAQQGVQRGLANLGQQALGTAGQQLGQQFNPQNVGLQTGLNGYGSVPNVPNLGNYGQAQSGPGAPDLTRYGQAQGGPQSPNLGIYGSAQGNVQAPDLAGMGQAQGGPSAGQYGMASGGPAAGQYGMAQSGPSAGQYGMAQGNVRGPNLQGLNTSGVAQMPISAGTTAQQAILARLNPQITQQNNALTQQLANQGITQGSEAYNNAQRVQGQNNNDLISQAALQGIGLDMSANQQGMTNALNTGNFNNNAQLQRFQAGLQNAGLNNSAVAQNFGMGQSAANANNAALAQNFGMGQSAANANNAAIGQNFGMGQAASSAGNAALAQNQNARLQQFQTGLANAGLYNSAIGQNQSAALNQFQAGLAGSQAGNNALAQNQNAALNQFQAGLSGAGFNNSAIGQNQNAALQQYQAGLGGQNQGFNQALQAGQFGNQSALQNYQQQLNQFNQPLNQISALMSGSQIQMPQFQGYTGQNVQAAPLANATAQQGQFAQNLYGQQMSAYNAQMQALGSAVGGAAGMFSFAPIAL